MTKKVSTKGWFTDLYSDTCGLGLRYKKILFHKKSKYQDIKILDSYDYEKILLLDNFIYRSSWFGQVIPEMIVHTPMLTGTLKKKVLLVGGGDGWSLAELVKYPSIKQIDLVEIDKYVVEACKRYFSEVKSAFSDKRVNIFIEDGNKFIDKINDIYDLILVTPSSPFDASGSKSAAYPICQKDYFAKCKKKLSKKGIFLTDGTNIYYSLKDIAYQEFTYKKVLKDLSSLYNHANLFCATSPLIPGGLFTLVIASNTYNPREDVISKPRSIKTIYYNSKYHRASFVLPSVI